MRHHNKNRKFGRERKQRIALLRSLALSLVVHGKIRTTEAKAKELRPYVEKLVTEGKKKTLASRRLLVSRLGSIRGEKKVADEISVRYVDRKGGYTRVIKLPHRKSDGSRMAIIEFV